MDSGSERALARLLVAEAALLLCAAPAVVMPTDWIAAAHEWLGLGPMPRGPLVEYLTRSLSMLYALIAPVLLALASDVRRFLPMVHVVGWLHVVGALVLTGLDASSGLPMWWLLIEGPVVLGLGAGQLALAGRIPSSL